jgi:hypothetical protein
MVVDQREILTKFGGRLILLRRYDGPETKKAANLELAAA